MKCPRCLNEDSSYFFHGSKGWYCRKCISFSRVCIDEEMMKESLVLPREESEEYSLKYALTPAQETISNALVQLIDTYDVLIYAVCGAGKTELVVKTIAKMLQRKRKVCFAIARRQVVLELALRLQEIFPKAKVVPVCGGYTSELDGDLIVCTTHQLYRYYQAFDCLILDEPDAFPFYGNDVLHGIAKTSCIGHTIYLTATPDEILLKQVKEGSLKCLTLNRRPHNYDLPVPKVKCAGVLGRLIQLLVWIKTYHHTPRMIFVPTIAMAKQIHRFVSIFEKAYVCTSKTVNRDEVIETFRKDDKGICVCTTVLERGVTIPKVNICVYQADHHVFREAALIQMAGRAGRSYAHPEGDVLFLLKEKSQIVDRCIQTLERANA